ncbi:MAG: ATP-dependent RecD-like DNA helicase [Clostridia bacterium]|nr:ATP-dependent RecD-like DNA helicase [Clostridia bacterium]
MKIEGKVATIIYKNNTNNYTVVLIKTDDDYITAVGETHELEVGDQIELEGIFDSHKTYGEQFKFSTYSKSMPKDTLALIQYISDNIKGIGKKTATNIVNEFGDDTVDVIRYSPDKLKCIKGLNEEKINFMSEYFNIEWDKWNVISYLSKFNISVVTANRIYQNLGKDTINIVETNPYSLLYFVKTLEFTAVDSIGQKLGLPLDSEARVSAGIQYALSQITDFGHTCVELDVLTEYSSDMLKVSKEVILNSLISLKLDEKVYMEEIEDTEYVFRRSFYLAEKNIAECVTRYSQKNIKKKNYDKEIENVSEQQSLVLSDEQKNAISTCLNSSLSIITGGPGTGKTTIIKCIIDILSYIGKTYVLCAPTGRAAKRITQTTGKEAKTLHRLLEITKLDDKDLDMFLNYTVKNIEADVLIVDESSMIDCLMMNNILKALNASTQIIFVGDVNQLPSVGPGSVLKDIIDSKVINTVYLNQIYRQSSKSDIILNAHKVNSGEYPDFKSKDTDLYYINTDSVDDTISEIRSLLSYRLENFAKLDIIRDVQILTPMKKNELGTIELNKSIQNVLNPKSSKKKQKEYGGRIYREGDKVMQIVNNYDKKFSHEGVDIEGIYNGDIGYIEKIDLEYEYLIVRYDDNKQVDYSFEELDELEHAYAVTIHKSQGSEFDYVIIPLFNRYPKLFTRNLLYTAMTRAKKMLILVGSRNTINYMVDNIEEKKRKTGLKYKIINSL